MMGETNSHGNDTRLTTATLLTRSSQKFGLDGQKCGHGLGKAILQRHVSLERLNPDYGCATRKSSLAVAITNLVATTTGGGVLSLPLAFRRAGILPTTFLMIYGFLATDFSLYVLVSCARRTGGRSYGDVASSAFGNFAEVATTLHLGLMLIGSLTAYLVLVKDTWTPVILLLLPLEVKEPLLMHQHDSSGIGGLFDPTLQASTQGSSLILLLIVIASAPLLLKHDLHALRFTCYIGFSSCILLMGAVVYRAHQAMQNSGRAPLRWYSTDIADYAFAFPIVVLCFFCSYNVLGVHSSLLHPTRERMKFVLDTSMFFCLLLFYFVGLGGYMYALDDTRDNILLNFPMHDPAVLLGRIGFCCTLLFGLPLVALPCREAFCAVPGQVKHWRADASLSKQFNEVDQLRSEGVHLVINGVDFDEQDPMLVTQDPEKQHTTMLKYGSTDESSEHVIVFHDDIESIATSCGGTTSCGATSNTTHLTDYSDHLLLANCNFDHLMHYASTFILVGVCYAFAISVPGVGFVWSLAGSSMAILIAFIIPTSCYLRIRQHKRMNLRLASAWTLLILSCIAAPICTQQAIQNAMTNS